MSTEYKAYFRMNRKTIDADRLQSFLKEYLLEYEYRPSYFRLTEDGRLQEELSDDPANWSQLIKEINEWQWSPNISLIHEQFYCTLGFINLGREKFGIWEISDGNLEELSEVMTARNSTVLQFFQALFQTLTADAMVWGRELSFEEALAFMNDSLAPETIRDCVRTAVGVLPARSLELLRSYGGRDLTIWNLKVVTQLFLGLTELPAPRVNRPEPVLVTTRPAITENLVPLLAMKYPELHA